MSRYAYREGDSGMVYMPSKMYYHYKYILTTLGRLGVIDEDLYWYVVDDIEADDYF